LRDLEDMKKGDRVTVRDASGKTYKYRVYERMIVDPDDFWVTRPVKDKKIISLQTCWPEPSFEKRLIVRAEIVK
jgi:sortase A